MAAEFTATNVTSLLVNAGMFFDRYVNIAGVVTNSSGAVILTFVAIPVGIGPNAPALARDAFAAVSVQTSDTVPTNLGGQTLNVYVGPQSAFSGAIVGALFTGGAEVMSAQAIVLGTSSGSGSGSGGGSTPGSFGHSPTPPPTNGSSASNVGRYLAYAGVGAGGLLLLWGAWDLELRKAGATRITLNE